MNKELQELYDSLMERMKSLEDRDQTLITQGRISELQLVIIKVQQMLLDSLKT